MRDSRKALEWLRGLGARRFFLKYCSTFDSTAEGNIGPVADALLDALGADFRSSARPTPRTAARSTTATSSSATAPVGVVDGHHPLTPMTDSDLVRVLGRQTPRRVDVVPFEIVRSGPSAVERRLADLRTAGVTYAVVDALNRSNLRTIARACARLPLVAGGAGVALGLPDNFRREGVLQPHAGAIDRSRIEGPVAVIAGSSSAATPSRFAHVRALPVAELDALDGNADALAAQAVSGSRTAPSSSTRPPRRGRARVQEQLGVERASSDVETALGQVARRLVDAGARTSSSPAARPRARSSRRSGSERSRSDARSPRSAVDDVAARAAADARAQVGELRRAGLFPEDDRGSKTVNERETRLLSPGEPARPWPAT